MNDDLNKDLENEFEDEDVHLSTGDGTDDVVVLDEELESSDAVKKLRIRLAKAIEEKQKYLDGWQREKADFINSRKREEEDRKKFLQFVEENLMSELIPVLDSFELAMANKEMWEKADKNWRTGVEYIHSQLLNILSNHGLMKIEPLKKPFDPKEHHSVGAVHTHKKNEDHVVLEVVSNGYSLNEKVIKPAQVKIGEYVPKAHSI